MINKLLKIIRGKELILYNPHRNSNPLLNETNRGKYVFFNPVWLWKATGIFGRKAKIRHKLYYNILTLLDPKYIIDINWIDIQHSIYLVWCNNHDRSFIVIQHGIYHGGSLRFIPEKYVKCNIFLVWGPHFKQLVESNNPGKDFKCLVFGNPCYNIYNRSEFSYKHKIGNRILVALSVVRDIRMEASYDFIEKLKTFGFDITVKEHAMQAKKSKPLEGEFKKRRGNLYEILQNQEYDIVVTDVSSAMTDIIFFKNRALYFSPEKPGSDLNDNVYSDYLENVAYHLEFLQSREELLSYVEIETQEKLLNYLIKTENTSNDLRQLENSSTNSPTPVCKSVTLN